MSEVDAPASSPAPDQPKIDHSKVELKKPPVLFDKTQQVIQQIESRLDGPLLTYWNSRDGSVCKNDVVGFYEILRFMGKTPKLNLFIKSNGGDGKSSLRIVHLMRQYAGHITALIPLEAASAATMMALGANQIHMGGLAYLTAVDTSLRHDLSPVNKLNHLVRVSQDEVTRIVKLWRKEEGEFSQDGNPYKYIYEHMHPLLLGAIDRASSLSIMLCREILSYHMEDEEKVERIAETLNASYPSHAYPITLKHAQGLGLHATELDQGVNDLLLELNSLYSEMGQSAVTDYDENNYHDNEIRNILEGRDIQIYYQNDEDWHYRKEERRWVSMNDNSGWHKIAKVNGETEHSTFHIN